VRAAIDAMEAYVPYAQRENARAHALAVSIGYAYPPPKAKGGQFEGPRQRALQELMGADQPM
jgi:hypothetical protein